MYHLHIVMGLGPWYRIGLSVSNAVLLVALVETMVTFNAASHSLAFYLAKYQYGFYGREPANVAADAQTSPQWVLFAAVLIIQIVADVLFWIAVIIKGNRHIATVWVMSLILKTSYTAFIHTFTTEEWERTYTTLEAIERISAFLWGTILFGFCLLTGIQAAYHLSTPEGIEKISPVGQGVLALRDFYREHLAQLAVVLLFSEIFFNVHRCFTYTETAYLWEAKYYLSYQEPPDEQGTHLSIATIFLNSAGLCLLAYRSSAAKKAWLAFYVILILSHLFLSGYILIDWSSLNIHSQMFNGFLAVIVVHLLYKVAIFYVYVKASRQPIPQSPRRSEDEGEGAKDNNQDNQEEEIHV